MHIAYSVNQKKSFNLLTFLRCKSLVIFDSIFYALVLLYTLLVYCRMLLICTTIQA